jgi:hypothetical protein
MPMLRACRLALSKSLVRLYLSILKLRVGPADSRTMRNEGAMGVSVSAIICVTPNVGAITR